MQTKRKIVSLAMGIMLTASLLTGCDKSNGLTALDFSNSTLSGIVTAVDDNKATIALTGGMGGGRMNGGMRDGFNRNGEMPEDMENEEGMAELPSGEDGQEMAELPEGGDGQTPPEMPDGEMPGDENGERPEMPEGMEGRERGGSFGGFSGNSSTFTLTIEDESLLSECTMADIQEGAYVTITFGEDNSISSITAMQLTNQNDSDTTEEVEADGTV